MHMQNSSGSNWTQMGSTTETTARLDDVTVYVKPSSVQSKSDPDPAPEQQPKGNSQAQQASPDQPEGTCWPAPYIWLVFVLGWVFPPLWWAAAAAGFKKKGPCSFNRRWNFNQPQAAPWCACIWMSVLSVAGVVLLGVLLGFKGQPTAVEGPFYMGLFGPPKAFPDMANPLSSQRVAQSLHAALRLSSSYPSSGINVRVQQQADNTPAPSSRHMLASPHNSNLLVLAYTLNKKPDLPPKQTLLARMKEDGTTTQLAMSLAANNFLPAASLGKLFVGLTTEDHSNYMAQLQERGTDTTEPQWAPIETCSGLPAAPLHSKCTCSGSSLPGTTCNVTCDQGYGGAPTATCGADGVWGVTGSCELNECVGNPAVPGGSFDCGNRSLPGTTCNGTCLTGFKGAVSSTCGADGWGSIMGSCDQIVCSNSPPDPVNGAFACSSASLPGSTCSAVCAQGYHGAPAVSCSSEGTWGDVAGRCELIECHGSPVSATASGGRFDCGNRNLPGTTCNGTCLTGFKGAVSSTCGEDGTWGNIMGSCDQVVCLGSPADPPNGAFACGASQPYGSVCRANCTSGFRGSLAASCELTGNWGPVEGLCSRIGEIPDPSRLQMSGTNKCIQTVAYTDGAGFQTADCMVGLRSQLFVTGVDEGYKQIKPAENLSQPLCLVVNGAGTFNNTLVRLMGDCNAPHAQWTQADGRWRPSHSLHKCLDVWSSNGGLSAELVINPCSAAPSQIFVPIA